MFITVSSVTTVPGRRAKFIAREQEKIKKRNEEMKTKNREFKEHRRSRLAVRVVSYLC
jgi:hypothetical protein